MSFFDDLGDAVKDVVSTVGEGAGTVTEALGSVLSPAEEFTMKGLGAATSTVSELFGHVDIMDVCKGMASVADVTLLPLLTMETAVAREGAANFLDGNPLVGVLGGSMRDHDSLIGGAADMFDLSAGDKGTAKEFDEGLAEIATVNQPNAKSAERIEADENGEYSKSSLEKMGITFGKKNSRVAKAASRFIQLAVAQFSESFDKGFNMAIFDNHFDAVKETRTNNTSGIMSEAFTNVLSPSEEFSMKGLAAAALTANEVFGSVEIGDPSNLNNSAFEIQNKNEEAATDRERPYSIFDGPIVGTSVGLPIGGMTGAPENDSSSQNENTITGQQIDQSLIGEMPSNFGIKKSRAQRTASFFL